MSTAWDPYAPAVLPPAPATSVREVTVASTDPLRVVETGGTPVAAVNGMPAWRHAVGDRVVVLLDVSSAVMIVASRASRPTRGKVTAVTGSTVTVQSVATPPTTGVTGESVQAPTEHVLSYVSPAPAVGDTVRILWDADGGTCLGKVGVAVPVAASGSVPEPPRRPSQLVIDVDPVAAATYRSGAVRSDRPGEIIQGHYDQSSQTADNAGVLVYGDVWGAAKGKTGRGLSITLKRVPGVGVGAAVPVHLRLHAHRSLPTGSPAFVGAEWAGMSLPTSGRAVVSLPPDVAADWLGRLASGEAAGIGVQYAGTAHYASFYGPDLQGSDGSGHLTAIYDA